MVEERKAEPLYISFGFVIIEGVEHEMLIPRPSYGTFEINKVIDSIKFRNTETGEFKDLTYADKTVMTVNPETGETETVTEKGKAFSKEDVLKVILGAWNSQAEPGEPQMRLADLQRAITYGVIEDQLRMQGVDEDLFFLPDVENFLWEISAYQRSITPAFVEGLGLLFGDIMKDPGRAGEILKELTPGRPAYQQATADYYYPAYGKEAPQIDWDKFYGTGPYEGQPAAAYGGVPRYPEGVTETQKAQIDAGLLPAGAVSTDVFLGPGALRAARVARGEMTQEEAAAEASEEGESAEDREWRLQLSREGQARKLAASPAGRVKAQAEAEFGELVKRSRRPQRIARL